MMKENDNDESTIVLQTSKKHPVFVYGISVLSAVGGFLFGYDTGVISGAMVLLKKHFNLDEWWQELIVSITVLSAWLFSIMGGPLTNRFGRKPVIIFSSFVFTVGAVMMGVAVYRSELLIGRIVVGVGIGLASMTVPVYIAEVSPTDVRGKLVTINNCCITIGQLVASICDGIFSKQNEGWRYMLGLAAIPSALQFFGFLFVPESPRWLTGKKKYDEAVKVLKKIRGQGCDVTMEFNSIRTSCMEQEKELEENGSDFIIIQVLKSRTLRRALAVGCGLQIFQQIAGINTVMYYSATIIQMAGVGDDSNAIWLSSATAAVNATCSLIGLLLIERLGRRVLTLGSLAGVIVSLAFLAISFQVADVHSPPVTNVSGNNSGKCLYSNCAECIHSGDCGFCYSLNDPVNGTSMCLLSNEQKFASSACNQTHYHWTNQWCPSVYSWMVLLGLLMYLLCFAPGMGSMPWTVNSEIYPLWARSFCYSTATSFNWIFNFAVSVSFLTLTQALTKSGAFWLYTGFSVIGFIFLFLMLPETRGKSLEEVEELFEQPWWKQMSFCGRKQTSQNVPNSAVCEMESSDDHSAVCK